jgi:hypothetical protein
MNPPVRFEVVAKGYTMHAPLVLGSFYLFDFFSSASRFRAKNTFDSLLVTGSLHGE